MILSASSASSPFKKTAIAALAAFALLALNLGAAQDLSFVVVTDTHIGSGAAASADLAAVVASINGRRDIGFVVHAGDITEKGRDSEFAEARRLLAGLSVPWFAVPGNHDAHWIGRGLAGYRGAFKGDHFFFKRGGRIFIGLSTGEFGHLAPEELAFLAASLEKAGRDEPAFVFMHFPPESVDNWFLAHNLLRERRATVFCGHGHATRILGPAGIPAVMARASVSRGAAAPWGYAIFRDSPAALSVEEVSGKRDPVPKGAISAAGREPLPGLAGRSFDSSGASVLWQADLKTTLLCAPIATEKTLIVQSLSGRLTAFDLAGKEVWSRDLGEPLIGRSAIRAGELFAATASGRVLRLSLATGGIAASAMLRERVTADLAFFDRRPGRYGLLAGTVTGALFCLDGKSLRTLWRSSGASDTIQSRPLVVSRSVVFGSWDARLHAAHTADGRELWTWTENDNFYYSPAGCSPATDGTRVFVSSPDGFVSAVDLASGRTIWRTKCSSWESLSLTPDRKQVLVKSRVDEFWILDAATGRPVRTVSPAHGPGDLIPSEPLSWEGSVIYGGQNGRVYLIPPNGPAVPILDLGPAAVFSIVSPTAGTFVAANADGRVVAFRLKPPPQAAPPARNVVPVDRSEPVESIIRKAANVVPSGRQLAWQELELIAFAHFGINTFTDREWGTGTEDPALFNPTAFDARQWVRIIKAAGMKQLILTAKHHDGFCLWPSRLTAHSVRSSPWKDGKGDVVAEVSAACREAGIGFGIYLSPWDRHEPTYGDSPKYNEFFLGQLRELLTGYGRVDEVWFDGANGEGPNGQRQVYDWFAYWKLVRELQPQAVIAIMGPDVRWVGTESGYGRETEWSVLPVPLQSRNWIYDSAEKFPLDKQFVPGNMMGPDLGSRSRISDAVGALAWYPAETDVSIRPGWFYHPQEDARVKTPEKLVDIYFSSVGRNGVLLLNVPPDKRGLIHENDAAALAGMRAILDGTFKTNLAGGAEVRATNTRKPFDPASILDADPATYWTTAEGAETARIDLEFPEERTFDRAVLQENIRVGQRIERFALERWDGTDWLQLTQGTTVGYKRILTFPAVITRRVRLTILESRTSPTLSSFGLYRAPPER